MDICNPNFLCLVLFSMLYGLAKLDFVCTCVFVSECLCVFWWLVQDFYFLCSLWRLLVCDLIQFLQTVFCGSECSTRLLNLFSKFTLNSIFRGIILSGLQCCLTFEEFQFFIRHLCAVRHNFFAKVRHRIRFQSCFYHIQNILADVWLQPMRHQIDRQKFCIRSFSKSWGILSTAVMFPLTSSCWLYPLSTLKWMKLVDCQK